jgi:hypothetical protein
MSLARWLRLVGRLAWRNLGRSPRRTAITGASVVLGVGLCVAMFGLTDGLDDDLIGSVTRVEAGEIQIHAPNWLAKRTLSLTIPDAAAHLREVEAEPGVAAAAPRVYTWGFASHGDRALGVELMGIDPAREARVTTLGSKIASGRGLPDAPTPWPESAPLTSAERSLDAKLTDDERTAALAEIEALGGEDASAPASPPPAATATATATASARDATRALVARIAPKPTETPPAVLGAKLAARLHVAPGATISVLVEDVHGATVDQPLRVVGTLRTGSTPKTSSTSSRSAAAPTRSRCAAPPATTSIASPPRSPPALRSRPSPSLRGTSSAPTSSRWSERTIS